MTVTGKRDGYTLADLEEMARGASMKRGGADRASAPGRYAVALLMAGLAACLAACRDAPRPEAREAIEDAGAPIVLALEPYVGRLVTLGGTLGADSLRLLFDTGGGQTLLAPDVAARVPCRPSGRSVGFRMSGERVEWPVCTGVPLDVTGEGPRKVTVGVWDLMAVLPEGLPHLDGLVSLKSFEDRALTLDLARRRVVIETASSLAVRLEGMTPVPIRLATGTSGESLTVFLRARVDGEGEYWLLLDSANLAETLLGRHVRADTASFDASIAFSDGLAVRAQARAADIIYDGALSEAALRQLIVTLDLARGAAWISRAGAPAVSP